jgi:hypothetical protein
LSSDATLPSISQSSAPPCSPRPRLAALPPCSPASCLRAAPLLPPCSPASVQPSTPPCSPASCLRAALDPALQPSTPPQSPVFHPQLYISSCLSLLGRIFYLFLMFKNDSFIILVLCESYGLFKLFLSLFLRYF